MNEPIPTRALRARPAPLQLAIGAILALCAFLVATVSGSAVAAPAGENTVVSSSPSDGAVLDVSPPAIIINFSQPVGEANTISVTCDAEILTLPPGPPLIGDDGLSLTVDLTENPLPSGTCTIRWSVVDEDGAANGSGVITFVISNDTVTTIATDDADTSTSAPAPAPTSDDTSSATITNAVPVSDFSVSGGGQGPVWLGRLLSTLAIAVLFGSLVTITTAWPEGVEYLVTIRFLRGAWIVAVIGTVLFTAAATAAVTDEGIGSGFSPANWGELADAGWAGRAVLARLLLVIACVWVAFRPDRAIDPTTQLAALGVPALATATIGFSRTVGDGAALGVAVGVVHAVAMAIWIGGVILLARVVLSGPGEEDLVHAVRGFSRVSIGAIIITIVSGFVQLVRLDGGDLFSSGHGRVLLLKSVVVAAMVFLAISARQIVGQRLARMHDMSVPMAGRLRRAFGAEAGIGVVTLAASAWLLAFTPNSIDDTPRIPYEVNAPISIEQNGEEALDLVLRLTDDRVGLVGMEVDVRSPDSGLSGLTITFVAPPNDLTIGSIVQPLPLTGAGVAVRLQPVGLPFIVAGDWTVRIDANTPLGPVSTEETLVVRNEDGSVPTTEVTLPSVNTVVVTTIADQGDG